MFVFMNVFFSLLVYVIFLMVMFLLSDYNFFSKSKFISFECGIENMKKSRVSFSSQFFFIGIVFIMFDMEIIFLVHFIFFYLPKMMITFLLFMFVFIFFMYITLLMEWKWSSLSWIF